MGTGCGERYFVTGYYNACRIDNANKSVRENT